MTSSPIEISKRLLLKHTATVHSSSRLTMIQKKIFNLFIYKAFPTIKEDKYHTYTVSDLLQSLNWSADSHMNDRLKEALAGLTRENVKWNILEKDRKNKWVSSACLADVSIKGGIIEFSFGKFLREVLHNPNIYAKIDLDVQGDLESRDSLIIWEFAMEELSSKKTTMIVTPWIEWEKMCSITSGENSSYSKTYSLYKSKVLNKAIDEINAKTDLNIVMIEQKESRKVKRIAFKVTKTNHSQEIYTDSSTSIFASDRDPSVKDLVVQIMGNTPTATSVWENHSDERLLDAVRFYRDAIISNEHSIKNPVAFFKKAVEEGWYSSTEAAERLQTIEIDTVMPTSEISFVKPTESDQVAKLRRCVYDDFGCGIYMAWFEEAYISINGTTCTLMHPNAYAPTYILQKLYHPLLKHIKMVAPSVLTLDVQQKQSQMS